MHEPADVGVIWDMDGTLVASATVVPDAFIETVHQLGGTPPDRDGVVALYDLGDPRVMLGRMLDRPGTDGDADRYHEVLGRMAGRVRVHDGERTASDGAGGAEDGDVLHPAARRNR